ncbi:MAG: hypothetical protein Q8P16_00780, partial [bacterium]|nr:hypothetical protein [bacterium]
AYGSAENMARLMSAAYRHAARAFESTALPYAEFHNAAGKAYEAQNTNGIVDAIPGLVMGKTGYTDLAGGNLAVVFEKEPGHAVVVVVLGSTREGRFNDVLELVEASIAETL